MCFDIRLCVLCDFCKGLTTRFAGLGKDLKVAVSFAVTEDGLLLHLKPEFVPDVAEHQRRDSHML